MKRESHFRDTGCLGGKQRGPNPITETQPTYNKGALRAADRISWLYEYDFGKHLWRKATAQIIHDETRQEAQQELLELADEAMGVLITSNEVSAYKLGRKIQAAIAKIKGEG